MIRLLRLLTLVVLLATSFVATTAATTAPAPSPDGTCILCVLSPTGTSARVTGSGSVTATKGNVLVNSTGTPALSLSGKGSLTAPSVGVAGTASVTGTGKVTNLRTGATPAADPLADLPVPSRTVPTSIPSVSVKGLTSTTIQPGVYKDISHSGLGRLTLAPGTYVVTGSVSFTGSGTFDATGVQLYLACASYPAPCSPGQLGATASFTGTGTVKLTGATANCASGIALFADRQNAAPITIAGSSKYILTGGIYGKSSTFTATGTSGTTTFGGPVVVGSATFNGTSAVAFTGSAQPASGLKTTLTATPTTLGVGGTTTVKATVSCCGKPAAGEQVTFTVTGANARTGSAVTNSSGVATFTYQGSNAGTDRVVARPTGTGIASPSPPVTITWTRATATVTGTPSAGGPVGTAVTDEVRVTSSGSPTGSVSWHIYAASDATCSTPLDSGWSSVPLSGGRATSPSFVATAPGTYQWVASYSGDGSHDPVAGRCGDPSQQVVITKATPSVVGQAAQPLTVGQSLALTATLSGGSNPTGRVQFSVYRASDSACATPLNAGLIDAPITSGAASATASLALTPGSYRVVAAYPGDANNTTASSDCANPAGAFTVAQATPSIQAASSGDAALGAPISSTAAVAGGYQPTGSVTWRLYRADDASCSAPLATGTLSAQLLDGAATSPTFTPTEAGTYQWVASYSGDVNNAPASSACGAAGAQVVVSPPADACSIRFTGGPTGAWEQPGNWSKGRVPSDADVVCVAAGDLVIVSSGAQRAGLLLSQGTVRVSGGSLEIGGLTPPANGPESSATAGLDLTGGTLTLRRALTVTGSFSASGTGGPTVVGPGHLVIADGAVASANQGGCETLTLDGTVLENHGAFADGPASGTGTGLILLANGAEFDNRGTLTVGSAGYCVGGHLSRAIFGTPDGSANAALRNSGQIITNVAYDGARIPVPFENRGTLRVASGLLELARGGAGDHGTWTVDGGGTLEAVSGSFQLGTATLTGPGRIIVRGATVEGTIADASTADLTVADGQLSVASATNARVKNLRLEGGVLALDGTLKVTGALTSAGISPGGTVRGAGELTVGSGGTADLNPGVCDRLTVEGITVRNQGDFVHGPRTGIGAGDLTLSSGARLINEGTMQLRTRQECIGGDRIGAALYSPDATTSIVNTGNLSIASGDTPSFVSGRLENSGTVSAASGTVQLRGGGASGSGLFSAAAGAQLAFGSGTYTLSSPTLGGDGTISVAGAIVSATTPVVSTQLLAVSGGSLGIDSGASALSLRKLRLTGGTLSVTGELRVSERLSSGGGFDATIDGPGTVTVASTATAAINGQDCSRLVLNGATLDNRGTLLDGAADGESYGGIQMTGTARILNSGEFTVGSNNRCRGSNAYLASFYVSDFDPLPLPGTGPRFINTGLVTFVLESRVDVEFVNDGTVRAARGTTTFAAGSEPGHLNTGCWEAAGGEIVFSKGDYKVEDGGTYDVTEGLAATVTHEAPGLSGSLTTVPVAASGPVTITGTGSHSRAGRSFVRASVQLARAGRDSWTTVCTATPNPSTGEFSCDWNTTTAGLKDGRYDVRAALTDDCAACAKTVFTAKRQTRITNYPLSLTPSRSGPRPIDTEQRLTATLVEPDGTPIAGSLVTFEVSGTHARTLTDTTNSSGVATVTYTGTSIGTDTVRASVQPASGPKLNSNVGQVEWSEMMAPVASTPVDGSFYSATPGNTRFTATPASTPAFQQTFPTLNFNPPTGANKSPWFVDDRTRPFTNLSVDQTGRVNGKTVAHGNGKVAGLNELRAFDASFRAEFIVTEASDVTFRVRSRDGFLFGIGGDATRVSGIYENTPASNRTPFGNLPLVAAEDRLPTGTTEHLVTVHFPAPGSYPYELDYFHAGGEQLSLGLTVERVTRSNEPLSFYIGYVDGFRPGGTAFPFPWNGSPSVTNFIGTTQKGIELDAGALRFDNNTDEPITIDSVSVDIGPVHADLWGRDIAVGPRETTILTQTAPENFDTSDFAPGACNAPSSERPRINVTIGGQTTTYVDEGQILNTLGIDPPNCNVDANESQPWTRISGSGDPIRTPVPPAVSLQITPGTILGTAVGQQQPLTVTARSQGGDPVANTELTIRVRGANARTITATTDSAGVARISYAGSKAGKDAVEATASISGLRAVSNQVIVPWAVPQAPGALLPPAPAESTGASPPSISNLKPVNGAAILAAQDVTATIAPAASITQWRTTLTPAGGSEIVLGVGSSAPAATLGRIDARTLPQGTYRLTVSATSAGGTATRSVLVTLGDHAGIPAPATTQSGTDAPRIVDLAPVDGAIVGISAPVTARAIVPQGVQVNEWTVTLQPRDGSAAPTVIGASTEAQPTPLAAIDPTRFADGTYTLAVTARSSNGGRTTVHHTLTLGLGAAQDAQLGGDPTGTSYPSTGGPGVGTTQSYAPPGVQITSPTPGATITDRVNVDAQVDPTDGDPIAAWSLVLQSPSGGNAREIASGTGTPPTTVGTLDPTVLKNDTYELTLTVTSERGAMQSQTVPVAVNGQLKPGRFSRSYNDISLPAPGISLDLGRTYDSYDKTPGEFGVGWRQSTGITVSTNGPLGAGGWSQYPDQCTFNACTYGYSSRPRHAVTVTWPDGHQEVFDFTPTSEVQNYLVVKPEFTARSGTATTSTLKATADADILYGFNGNLEEGASGSPWDPKRFVLTTKTGVELVLDVDAGLVSTRDRDGNTITVDRDGMHSTSGRSIELTRDAEGRVVRAQGPAGQARTYGYSPAGDLTSVTDALGNTVHYEYDDDHNLVRTIDPSGRPMRTVQYDADGRISSITDALGNTVDLDISGDGREQIVTSPDGRLTTVTATDDRGNPTQVRKIAGGQTRTWSYDYDGEDNPTRTTDPLGNTTSSTYDENSNLTSSTDGEGLTTRYEYDATSLLVKTIAPDGEATMLTRDAAGHVTAETDPLGNVSRYEYNEAGQLKRQVDPLGRAFRTFYNPEGDAVVFIDAAGAGANATYDGAGQLTSIRADGMGTTQLRYDDNGQLTSMTDPLGQTTSYAYDALGRRTHETDPLGNLTVTSYDAAGQRSGVLDREGVQASFAYDQQGRLTEKVVGGERTSYEYDAFGRVVGAANDDAVIATGYDAADRPTSFSTRLVGSPVADTVSYAYDAAGRRSSMSYGGVTDAYGYDAAGRVSSITSSAAGAFSFAYDAAGRRTVMRRPNGVDTSFAFDAAGQVTSIEHARGGTVLDEARYTYDAAGRRTVMRSFAGDHVYGYDSVGRVINADNPGSLADEVFSYDDLGNRTSGGEQYDGAGRLTARNGFTYLSDREGRVTSRIASNGDTTEFGWSDDGRLESITLPDGTVQQVKYDPLGRRIATTDGAGGTLRQTYGLDPNAVAEDSGGDVSRMTFALGYDQPLAMTTAAASVYFQQDALSSVTSLTDQTGTVTGRYGYDTYGQITSHTGQDSPYTYTGRQYNPQAGIYDYRARWYEPDTGRFLTQDPVPAANQYWYADGNPVSANDPTGRMSVSEVATSDVVISALVTANANYWGSVIRCGVPDSVSDGAKILGLGALQGAIFGGLSSFIAKRIVAKVGEDGLTAAALALLAFGWVSSYPRHVVGNGDTHVDPFDPLGWLIDTIAQQGTGVGGEAWGSPMGKAVMAVLDTIAGTATSAAFGRCPG